ncbi:MAG: radical SAM protein [Firmicutes bacterium]|nr:radical SAM protein [Bacillota bacterium]
MAGDGIEGVILVRYIFGPVPSRRLGLSLGVDIVPFKTCSFDCIYCQLGRTTCKTIIRDSFVSFETIVNELKGVLPKVTANYITFSGSGEPTLNLDLGRLIREAKELTSIPVAVLTNSSLFGYPEVRRELLDADLVVPSLDAASQEVFGGINRPYPGLKVNDIIHGIKAFSSDFGGKLWIEVMLVKGVNDDERELARISSALKGINAEKIQLNTVERPPAESFAKPLTEDEMERIKSYFDERVEVITAPNNRQTSIGQPTAEEEEKDMKAEYDRILNLLKRRPCTLADVASGLGLNMNEASKYLGILLRLGLINVDNSASGKTYFHG